MTSMEAVMVAARRKLLADAGFLALIGTDVGQDSTGQAYADGWVFKATNDEYAPDRSPRGTGKAAVVFGMRGPGWAQPNNYNTLDFPELEFRIYTDSSRTSDGSLIQRDSDYRCGRVADAIVNVFNDVANNDHDWPNGVKIVSCVLWNRLKITDIDNEDGLVVGDLSFALELP